MLLLDTNVISELRKVRLGRAPQAVIDWEASVTATELYLSSATIHELELGTLLLEKKDPRQAWTLRRWLDDHVIPTFRGRILPIDIPIMRRSAYLHSLRTRSVMDTLIAATAYVHNMTVVTRNVVDFRDTAVQIDNPWTYQPPT